MDTQTVSFMPHGLHSREVQARIAQGKAVAIARTERINTRVVPHIRAFNARLTELVNNDRDADYCIPEFWRVIDELMALNGDDVACKRGCSHCCHISVLMTREEAEVIGKRIGREPLHVAAPGRNDESPFDWGYHNPCTFLRNGECSIYENRPLPCRLQYSVDVDALLCELTPPESKPVWYMNPHPFLMAFLQMLGVPDVIPVFGDIRDFFPKVTNE